MWIRYKELLSWKYELNRASGLGGGRGHPYIHTHTYIQRAYGYYSIDFMFLFNEKIWIYFLKHVFAAKPFLPINNDKTWILSVLGNLFCSTSTNWFFSFFCPKVMNFIAWIFYSPCWTIILRFIIFPIFWFVPNISCSLYYSLSSYVTDNHMCTAQLLTFFLSDQNFIYYELY